MRTHRRQVLLREGRDTTMVVERKSVALVEIHWSRRDSKKGRYLLKVKTEGEGMALAFCAISSSRGVEVPNGGCSPWLCRSQP
jgi:hypothetical protein